MIVYVVVALRENIPVPVSIDIFKTYEEAQEFAKKTEAEYYGIRCYIAPREI